MSRAAFVHPRVEPELAFVLKKPMTGRETGPEALAAVEAIAPALEIIDARIEQFDRDTKAPRKVFDTISDFAANAGIVLGGRPVKPDALDLRWVGAMLFKNGVIEETGLAAGVLNHPATGVAWPCSAGGCGGCCCGGAASAASAPARRFWARSSASSRSRLSASRSASRLAVPTTVIRSAGRSCRALATLSSPARASGASAAEPGEIGRAHV